MAAGSVLQCFFFLFAAAVAAQAARLPVQKLELDRPLLQASIVDLVNRNPKAGWTAGMNERFTDYSVRDFKRLCGSIRKPVNEIDPAAVAKVHPRNLKLPKNFDAREAWPQCPTVKAVLDQGHCGSCWAFGAVESLTDRFCILANQNVTLSENDLLSCCGFECGFGCDGGYPYSAWQYFQRSGVVTSQCDPYFDEKGCKHPGCEPGYDTPQCVKQCKDNEDWSSSKHYSVETYPVNSAIFDIQAEIYKNGPVEVSYEVYEDFAHYKSGVYKHVYGEYLGGHAVKVIGWGTTDDGQDYWLVANSWNRSWGDDGFFKIARGTNECEIESEVVAGLPLKYGNTMLASILTRTPRCSIACAPARELEVQRSGGDEEDDGDEDSQNWFLEDSREYVTRIPVKRQKYIPVSKVALVNAALPGFSSSSEASNFLAICSCLEAILHAEHKVVLEELRVDRADDELFISRDGGTHLNGHASSGASISQGNEKEDINGAASRRSSSSRIARFQKNLLMLLRNAEFQELSVRDLQLAAALNSDYLLTLPINVDWKSASSANVIIFRRGYETEKQTGYLLGAKLDYAQSLVLRKLSSILLLPLLQASRTFIQKNQAAENGNGTAAWTEAVKKWLEEPLPPDNNNDAELDLASSTAGDEGDLPIWLAARRAVPRYEAVLSGSRGKLLRRVLAWLRILPPEGTDINKLFVKGPPTGEPHLRPNYLRRVSMRDIWLQLNSQKSAWKKLRTVWSILFAKSMLQEPAFKELVVIHEKVAPPGDELDQPSRVELSAYTNIPVPDLKVVFPNKRLSFRLLDTVRLDLTTVLGLLAFLVNYRFDDILSSPSAFVLDIVATGSLLVFATRAALGYKQTWDRYELLVNKTLYEKTLASDFGVVHFLVDASEEQQLKQAILLYGLLLQAKNQELALNAVATTCERYMYSKFKEQIEMPVEDAVRILLRLGLVSRMVNVLQAKPHAEAVLALESKWQALLTSHTIWMSSDGI